MNSRAAILKTKVERSAGEPLIEFLDFDFSKLFSLVKNIDSYSGEEIYSAVNELGKSTATPFLIKNMTDRDWANAYDNSLQWSIHIILYTVF